MHSYLVAKTEVYSIDILLKQFTGADPGICIWGGAIPLLSYSPLLLPFHSLSSSCLPPSPLEVGPLKQLEGLGSSVSSPGALAENEFGAL